jgi:predicted nucleic acid-binding protein
MAASVLVDASFLVALLNRQDVHRKWAAAAAQRLPPPWITCQAVLTEAFYLLGNAGASALCDLLRHRTIACRLDLDDQVDIVIGLMEKYADVPMSFADACLVRMTEALPSPILLTTDSDFRVYRRHSRQTIPCETPD